MQSTKKTMPKVIELKNVSAGYGQHAVVKNLSFSLHEQETLLFDAPSGSGKTTLIETILGFRPLIAGEIFVMQKKIFPNANFIYHNIAWMPQALPFHQEQVDKTFNKILNFKANQRLQYNDLQKSFELFAEQLALEKNVWQKKYSQLSGGEKQKTALILCALLKRPIWILDEPTSALDKNSLKLTINFLQEQKAAKLISNHNRDFSKYFPNKISWSKHV